MRLLLIMSLVIATLTSSPTTSLAQNTGTVMLTVIPPGAEIWIDGKLRGKSPLPAFQLTVGTHQMEIKLTGYTTLTKSITVETGQTLNKVVTLLPLNGETPTPATTQPVVMPPVSPDKPVPPQSENAHLLMVNGIPKGSTLSVNGSAVKFSGSTATTQLVKGLYTIHVMHPKLGSFIKTVQITTQEKVVVSVVFANAETGTPASPVTPKEAPPEPSQPQAPTTIAGSWSGTPLLTSKLTGITTTAKMSLQGSDTQFSGVMTLHKEAVLPHWKRRVCSGANVAAWTIRYGVSASVSDDSNKLYATNGEIKSCSCEGMCPFDTEMELPLLVSNNKQVIVANETLFLRTAKDQQPALNVHNQVKKGVLSGEWKAHISASGNTAVGNMTLSHAENSIAGTYVFKASRPLQNWRKRQCRNAPTVTATHEFKVVGFVPGSNVKLDFNYQNTTECSCRAACNTTRSDVNSIKLNLISDDNHLVGPDLLLERMPTK